VIVATSPSRLAHARKVGFETVDLSAALPSASKSPKSWRTGSRLRGHCVGFEHADMVTMAPVSRPATVLNSLMEVTRAAGRIGVPGLYVTRIPVRSMPPRARQSQYSPGLAGQNRTASSRQTPVMKYNRN